MFFNLVAITLRLYGSSCTKFGFKDSDVNIDIQFPPQVSRSLDNVNIQSMLQFFKNVELDLVPCFKLRLQYFIVSQVN